MDEKKEEKQEAARPRLALLGPTGQVLRSLALASAAQARTAKAATPAPFPNPPGWEVLKPGERVTVKASGIKFDFIVALADGGVLVLGTPERMAKPVE